MNTYQKHDVLVGEYTESAQTIRRFRMHAFMFQAVIWAVLICLKNLQVPHVKLIAVILFGIFLLSRVRDFNLWRNLDIRMSQVILEGFKLERGNPRLETFFHQVLEQFGVIRVIILRAVFDVMALYFFVRAAYGLALDYNPDLAMNIKTYYPALGLLGFFLSDLYYKPLKSIMRTKQEAFSS